MAKTKRRKVQTKARSKTKSRAGNKKTSRSRNVARQHPIVAKGMLNTITDAAIDAAIELGAAAENFRKSLKHVTNARDKGGRAIKPAIKPMRDMTRKATRTAKRVMARVTG